jgi:phage terminase small subunit
MSDPLEGLTVKQRKFCEAYVGEAAGNATEAARIAGYSSPRGSASANMAKAYILEAIKHLSKKTQEASGALTIEEIHQLWGDIARDAKERTSDRLAALRDAARANGAFLDRTELSGEVKTSGAEEIAALLGLSLDDS